MKEGVLYVLHCEGNRFISRLIRKSTKGKTHTAFAYTKNGITTVFDAQSGGLYARGFKVWNKKYGYTFNALPVEGVDLERAINLMRIYYGWKYGFTDLLKHWVWKNFGIWLLSENEREKVVCSELVMNILKKLEYYNGDTEYRMNPEDVYQWHKWKLIQNVK